jgi:hypothetical protein
MQVGRKCGERNSTPLYGVLCETALAMGKIMRPLATCACVFILSSCGPALAEITITRAEYARGVLFVRGETSRSNQLVTLDRRYRTRTNRVNEFRFRIPYLPRDCIVTIRAGQEVRPARIANCEMASGSPRRKRLDARKR